MEVFLRKKRKERKLRNEHKYNILLFLLSGRVKFLIFPPNSKNERYLHRKYLTTKIRTKEMERKVT